METQSYNFRACYSFGNPYSLSLLSNGMIMMWKIRQAKQNDAEFIRRIHPAFISLTGLKCSYGKFSSPLTEIPVGKPEIWGTEPARLLISTRRKFY